jgi:hypothetical protein
VSTFFNAGCFGLPIDLFQEKLDKLNRVPHIISLSKTWAMTEELFKRSE